MPPVLATLARRPLLWWSAVLLVALVAGISVAGLAYTTSPRSATTPITLTSYRPVTVVIRSAPGPNQTTRISRMLLADTEPLAEHGLMGVTDSALGGYDGMLFAFSYPTTMSFWMRNTSLPLSLVFVNPDGSIQPAITMVPCGNRTNCPSYAPRAPYFFAVEVPTVRLPALGLVSGVTVTVVAP